MTEATVECNKSLLNDGTRDEVNNNKWNSHFFGRDDLKFQLHHGPDQDSPVVLLEPSGEGSALSRVPEVPEIPPGSTFHIIIWKDGNRKTWFTIKHDPVPKLIEIDRTSNTIQTDNSPLPGKGCI